MSHSKKYKTKENLLQEYQKHSERFSTGDIVTVLEPQAHILVLDGQGNWNSPSIKLPEEGMKMSLYDLNKTAVNQMNDLTISECTDLINKINDFDLAQQNQFYMLLCNDLNYYTIFQNNSLADEFETLGDAVVTCLKDTFVSLKAFEINDSGIEIWIKQNNQSYMLMLFAYDGGIVQYGH